MSRRVMTLWLVIAVATSFAAATESRQPAGKLTAAEIADRNVAARGGLQAWRGVQGLKMTGKLDAGGNNRPTLPTPAAPKSAAGMPAPRPAEQVQLPFVLEAKRPRKSRIEIEFKGQKALQVYDGANGWKLRPFLNRMDVEPYTAEELTTASLQSDIDGPIVDYAAKGTAVELNGTEKVEGRECYKLALTTKSGQVTHVWIDAGTFLEAKMDGVPRRLDGKYRPVEIYLRDYRSTGGLQIPYTLETRVQDAAVGGASSSSSISERIILDKVEVNPPLSDALFSRAQMDAAASDKPAPTLAKFSPR